MIENIRKEKEMWAKYYNNYDNLAASLLTDILAFLSKDERQVHINASLEALKRVEEPLDGKIFFDNVKINIESFEIVNNEYNNLVVSLLTNILAFLPEDKRQGCIDASLEILKNIKEPINGKMFFDSVKMDIESFERINNESAVAYRTLEWVEGLMNAETEKEQKVEE